MKLVLNTWLAFEVDAAAEVAAVAARLGVPYRALLDTVNRGPLVSGVAMNKLAKMEAGDYFPDFSLEWALKDLDLAEAAAGVEALPVAGTIAARWRRLVADGYGRLDISAARMELAGNLQPSDPGQRVISTTALSNWPPHLTGEFARWPAPHPSLAPAGGIAILDHGWSSKRGTVAGRSAAVSRP